MGIRLRHIGAGAFTALLMGGPGPGWLVAKDPGDAALISRHKRAIWTGTSPLFPQGSYEANVVRKGPNGMTLWNRETNEFLRHVEARQPLLDAQLSPDGRRLLLLTTEAGEVWDLRTGAVATGFAGFPGNSRYVTGLFSPDGGRVVRRTGSLELAIYDATTGERLRHFTEFPSTITAAAFSPDGDRLLIGMGTNVAIIIDADSGETLTELQLPETLEREHDFDVVEFLPDGQRVVIASYNSYGALHDAATGQAILHYFDEAQQARINSLAVSPDGSTLAFGVYPTTFRVLRSESGQEVRNLDVAWNRKVMAFSADGTRVMDSGGWTYGIADGEGRQEFMEPPQRVGSFEPISEKMVAAGSPLDSSLHVLNLVTGRRVHASDGHGGVVSVLAVHPGGELLLSASPQGTPLLWDVQDNQAVRSFPELQSSGAAAFSADGELLVIGTQFLTEMIRWETGEVVATYHAGDRGVALSPDGSMLLTATGYGVDLWDVETGDPIPTYDNHWNFIRSVAFAPGGTKHLTSAMDGGTYVWETASGAFLQAYNTPSTGLGAQYSADGRRILNSNPSAAFLWDEATAEQLHEYRVPGSSSGNTGARFSADESMVLTNYENSLRLWLRDRDYIERAIIVAGASQFTPNTAEAQHRFLANQIAHTCTMRGILPDDVYYASALDDPAENPMVDAEATLDGLEAAIAGWAADTVRLTIFLVGHGHADTGGSGEIGFPLRATRGNNVTLEPVALDAWLDAAQEAGVEEVLVVTDFNEAASFASLISSAPEGTRRVVLASAAAGQRAAFAGGMEAPHSFTSLLLGEFLDGVAVDEAFFAARDPLQEALGQQAWMDDNGDGLFTETDSAEAARMAFGTALPLEAVRPEITATPTSHTVPAGRSFRVELQTNTEADGADVILTWAIPAPPTGRPVTELPSIAMEPAGTPGRWSALLPATAFPGPGSYRVAFSAYREDPLAPEFRLHAPPASAMIYVEQAGDPDGEAWEVY